MADEDDMVDQPDDSCDLPLNDHLCFAVYSTMHAIGRTYAPLLERLGLTYAQYLVMRVLWERDGVTVKAVGERLFLDSGTLTPLLKRLEAAGLVTRRRNPADERQVLLDLTREGRDLRRMARAVPADLACAMALPVEEIENLKRDLLRLRSNLMASLGKTAKVQLPSEEAEAGRKPAPAAVPRTRRESQT